MARGGREWPGRACLCPRIEPSLGVVGAPTAGEFSGALLEGGCLALYTGDHFQPWPGSSRTEGSALQDNSLLSGWGSELVMGGARRQRPVRLAPSTRRVPTVLVL